MKGKFIFRRNFFGARKKSKAVVRLVPVQCCWLALLVTHKASSWTNRHSVVLPLIEFRVHVLRPFDRYLMSGRQLK